MPGEPSTRRGRASRERIVERAAELFAERGIAATSVDEVLAAAGAGKGQFYHYFHGRDELAAAVGYRCAQVVIQLTEALGDVSSRAGLERALAGFVAGFEQSVGHARVPADARSRSAREGASLHGYDGDWSSIVTSLTRTQETTSRLGSQTGSQQPQSPGDIRPLSASISPAQRPNERYQVTCSDRSPVPSKQRVAGSNPAWRPYVCHLLPRPRARRVPVRSDPGVLLPSALRASLPTWSAMTRWRTSDVCR